MVDVTPAVDFSAISFPTDRLSVRDLRRIYPHSFDLPSPYKTGHAASRPVYGRNTLESTLGGIIDAERLVAGVAFKRAAGLPLNEEEVLEPPAVVAAGVASSYIEIGLASGDHHASQMVRDIERQAAAQGRPGHNRG